MSQSKPLNFAQALRSKPTTREVESTNHESQLSTILDSQIATEPAIQIPPPSLLSTTISEPAIQQAPKRKVESHRRKLVDI